MPMTMNEKKALYAFGCPNREATVERLRYAAVLATDPATKKLFFMLAVKLSDKDCDRWYRCFFYHLRLELEYNIVCQPGNPMKSAYERLSQYRKEESSDKTDEV